MARAAEAFVALKTVGCRAGENRVEKKVCKQAIFAYAPPRTLSGGVGSAFVWTGGAFTASRARKTCYWELFALWALPMGAQLGRAVSHTQPDIKSDSRTTS